MTSKKIIYCILTLGALFSRLYLVSKYPGDVDPALYIISFTQMLSPAMDKISGVFNYDISFGYYYLISIIYRLARQNISHLIILLNYLSAVFGAFLILIFGVLTKRLAGRVAALFGMMILLVDHSLWNWSLYTHPTVLSVSFFLFSLYFFDKAVTGFKPDIKVNRQVYYLVLSGLMGLAALLLRVDILLVFAMYFLLWNYRLKDGNKGTRSLLLFYTSIFSLYLMIRFLTLDYVIDFEGDVLIQHFHNQFELRHVPRALFTNSALFAAGMGVLYVIVGFICMIAWCAKHRRFCPATLLSVAPIFIVAFFERMDFARIAILIHPMLAFFAAVAFKRILMSLKKPLVVWGIGIIIVTYILQTAMVYYPLKMLWLHKFPFQPLPGVVVRPVPIGWFLSDRKNRLRDEKHLFQHALFLSQQKKDVLVVCSRLHAFRLAALLLQLCPGSEIESDTIDGVHHDFVHTFANTYRIVTCESKAFFDQLSGRKDFGGYPVYFLNDLQFPYHIIIKGEGK